MNNVMTVGKLLEFLKSLPKNAPFVFFELDEFHSEHFIYNAKLIVGDGATVLALSGQEVSDLYLEEESCELGLIE